MTVPTSSITFTCVKDNFGNIIPDGKHHSSRASSYFHKWLMEDLKKANTKIEAKLIIAHHHKNHMVLSKPTLCSCNKKCK